jgi:hypothetical protein
MEGIHNNRKEPDARKRCAVMHPAYSLHTGSRCGRTVDAVAGILSRYGPQQHRGGDRSGGLSPLATTAPHVKNHKTVTSHKCATIAKAEMAHRSALRMTIPDTVGVAPAAVLLTRVVSKSTGNRVTIDFGIKSIPSDPALAQRVKLLDVPPYRYTIIW